jgi:hypothetical protein
MNPLLFVAVWALVCAGAFALGLRFFRMTEPTDAITLDQARRFGRLLMMAAAAMLLFLVAALVHGDLKLGQPA